MFFLDLSKYIIIFLFFILSTYQMKLLFTFCILFLSFAFQVNAQNEKNIESFINPDLPYFEIPDAPESYSAGNVAARVIDGLGFRYYWATQGLRNTDLDYKPSEEARTTAQTIDHIYGLSRAILNAMEHKANGQENNVKSFTFEEIRKKTLVNFKNASDILKDSRDGDIKNYKVIFGIGENSSEFPFWNLLNGQIADAIYHTGQVVSFRRSSGNPINQKVRVFTGTVTE